MIINKHILQKYFAGSCNEHEQEMVEQYLRGSDAELSALHELMDEEAINTTGEVLPDALDKVLRKRIFRYVFINGVVIHRVRQLAAAAAVLLPIFFIWHSYFRKAEVTTLVKAGTSEGVDGAWKTIFNQSSTGRKAVMPDGTQIWLTAFSKIEYNPFLYGKRNREIKLEGEAFFDVARDSRYPFTVRHGAIVTHVLGTSFNVEAYEDEAAIRIALMNGKVMISHAKDTSNDKPLRILKPGQVLSYKKKDGSFKVGMSVMKEEGAWKQGNIIFDDILLKDALLRLQRIYDINFAIPDNIDISRMHVTAVFKGGTAEQVLQNLLFVHNLHFKIQNKVVKIY